MTSRSRQGAMITTLVVGRMFQLDARDLESSLEQARLLAGAHGYPPSYSEVRVHPETKASISISDIAGLPIVGDSSVPRAHAYFVYLPEEDE